MIVNIYIETSTLAVRALSASGMYLMEAVDESGESVMKNGEPVVVYEQVDFAHININIMVMTLLETALSRLQKPCTVHIYTKCESVYWALKNDWITSWKNNDWKTAKGIGVKNHEKWKIIEYLLNKNEHWTVSNETHSWERWMRERLKDGGKKNVG